MSPEPSGAWSPCHEIRDTSSERRRPRPTQGVRAQWRLAPGPSRRAGLRRLLRITSSSRLQRLPDLSTLELSRTGGRASGYICKREGEADEGTLHHGHDRHRPGCTQGSSCPGRITRQGRPALCFAESHHVRKMCRDRERDDLYGHADQSSSSASPHHPGVRQRPERRATHAIRPRSTGHTSRCTQACPDGSGGDRSTCRYGGNQRMHQSRGWAAAQAIGNVPGAARPPGPLGRRSPSTRRPSSRGL